MTQQFERRFINEWVNTHKPDVHWQTRVWLGPLPPGKEAAEYQVVGKWADAILFEPSQITIVEAKLEPDAKAVGQLEMYEQEFGKTLRFNKYWRLPIQKVLLTTRVDEAVKQVCDAHHVEYVVFRPDWVVYWEKRRFRV